MHHSTRQSTRTANRTQKSSLNPYVLDDVAFTLSDIRRAREQSESTDVQLTPGCVGGRVGTFGPISAHAPVAR